MVDFGAWLEDRIYHSLTRQLHMRPALVLDLEITTSSLIWEMGSGLCIVNSTRDDK